MTDEIYNEIKDKCAKAVLSYIKETSLENMVLDIPGFDAKLPFKDNKLEFPVGDAKAYASKFNLEGDSLDLATEMILDLRKYATGMLAVYNIPRDTRFDEITDRILLSVAHSLNERAAIESDPQVTKDYVRTTRGRLHQLKLRLYD